jgi:nucleotide-binding universal stress UspA family protein
MFTKIMVPLDGSRYSGRALKYAAEIAQRFNTELLLMQVVTPTTPVTSTTGAVPGIESPASTRVAVETALAEDKRNSTRAKRYLRRKVRETKSHNIKVSYKVLIGWPAATIMELASKEHIDLIVLTTHGKGGIKRAVMGSITDEVVRESGKPVLVINPRAKKK